MHQRSMRTKSILLDTGKCEACWKCIETCANDVIGKINFFFHKHAVISTPGNCTGCLKCTKVCTHEAIRRLN